VAAIGGNLEGDISQSPHLDNSFLVLCSFTDRISRRCWSLMSIYTLITITSCNPALRQISLEFLLSLSITMPHSGIRIGMDSEIITDCKILSYSFFTFTLLRNHIVFTSRKRSKGAKYCKPQSSSCFSTTSCWSSILSIRLSMTSQGGNAGLLLT